MNAKQKELMIITEFLKGKRVMVNDQLTGTVDHFTGSYLILIDVADGDGEYRDRLEWNSAFIKKIVQINEPINRKKLLTDG